MGIKESNFTHTFFEIFIKIIKVFFAIFMVALILFTFDGVIGSSTGTHEKAKFAIVYNDKKIRNSDFFPKVTSKIDLAIGLLNKQKVEKIILTTNRGYAGKILMKSMEKYIFKKGITQDKIIFDLEGITNQEVSKNTFLLNKSYGNFPNVAVIGISEFYNLSKIHNSLEEAGFSFVGSESPKVYNFRDMYIVANELTRYYLDATMLLVNSAIKNKEEIKQVKNKIVVVLKDSMNSKKAMIKSMNNYHYRNTKSKVNNSLETFLSYKESKKNIRRNMNKYYYKIAKNTVNSKVQAFLEYRNKQQIIKRNSNKFYYAGIKKTIDDTLIITNRVTDDIIIVTNAFAYDRVKDFNKVEESLTEKIFIAFDFFAQIIVGIKDFIINILYIPIDFIISIGDLVGEILETNSQNY